MLMRHYYSCHCMSPSRAYAAAVTGTALALVLLSVVAVVVANKGTPRELDKLLAVLDGSSTTVPRRNSCTAPLKPDGPAPNNVLLIVWRRTFDRDTAGSESRLELGGGGGVVTGVLSNDCDCNGVNARCCYCCC